MVTRSASALQTEIISTLSKPIPTKELLARLQKLSDDLSAVDQLNVLPDDYTKVAQDLANKKLLNHQNVGIRAFACCALADILRIFAPDAPFTPAELSRIFKSFFAQLSLIWDEQNAYFLQQCYLLKRIVEVRSVILVADLPDALQLITQMFETMYTVANKGFPPRLEQLASEMLAETISEADSVPQKVVLLVLKKLTTVESDLTGSSSNISNTAFTFSLSVCEGNVDKMSRQVAQVFSEMLDESAKSTDDGDIDYNASYQTLEKIHTWSIHIWKHVPDLLGSVMGLIGDELNSDSENIRVLATTTIGSMIAASSATENNAVHFLTAHRSAWTNWLKKYSDVSPMVRSKWAEQVPAIVVSQSTASEVTRELGLGLSKCLKDSNERVRFASTKAYELLPFSVFCSQACNESILSTFFQLIREKNPDIRNKAINVLATFYNEFMVSTSKDEMIDFGELGKAEINAVESMINDIPNKLLQLNYINDRLITTSVDVALFEKLVPFENDVRARVFRLCSFYKVLDHKSKQAFLAITRRQKKNVEVLEQFLSLCETYCSTNSLDNKENVSDVPKEKDELLQKVDKIILWLTKSFPDGLNSYDSMDRFFKLKNMRLINLAKNCISADLDYKTVKNSIKELLVKLSDPKHIRISGDAQITTADMVSNTKILLYRSSAILYNKSNINELLFQSLNSDTRFQDVSNELINNMSSIFPDLFKNHASSLVELIIKDADIHTSLLQSYYHFVKKFPDSFPEDMAFTDALVSIATKGSPEQAKYSIKIIGCSEGKELLTSRIVNACLPFDTENEKFATHLSSFAEIYLVSPLALSELSDEINSVIVEKVLRINRISQSYVDSLGKIEWIDDAEMPSHPILLEKLLALRLLLNRLRSIATPDFENDLALHAAKPIRLLTAIITNSGEIVKKGEAVTMTPRVYQLRLRLASGLLLLKLAKYPCFNSLIDIDAISKMTRLLHDDQIAVRRSYLRTLQKYLSSNTVSERFLHLIFFMGHEPDASLNNETRTWILSQRKRCEAKNDIVYERILVRLIHSLSHDQRFMKLISEEGDLQSVQVKAYLYALRYFSLYLETIAKEANISLLYYFASRVKQYRDATIDVKQYDEEELSAGILNLYRVSELLQLMLKELADTKGWNLHVWPGKINLPSDIFAPMGDYQEAQRIISRVYIVDDVQIELRQALKGSNTSAAKKRSQPAGEPSISKKQKTTKSPKKRQATTKKPTKKSEKRGAAKSADVEADTTIIRRSTRVRATRKPVTYEESDEDEEEEDERAPTSDEEFDEDSD